MDKIKIDDLKRDFPKTWEAINTDKNSSYIVLNQVNIRRFLERNGYSICCLPLLHSSKAIPQIVYRGSEVGKDGFFRVNDFEPMTMSKAKKTGLMFALRDFEKQCYSSEPVDWY